MKRRLAHMAIRAVFLLCLFHAEYAAGSFENLIVGGRAWGLCGADVALVDGAESIFSNPAGLSLARNPACNLFVCRPYGIEELTYGTFAAVVPTPFGGLGAGLQTFGNRLYRETCLALGWGNRYRDRVHYGFVLKLAHLRIERYESATALLMEAGCLLRLTQQVSWGVSFSNLNHARIGSVREPLPQVMRTGLCFELNPGILLSVELDKDTRYPAEFKAGCECHLLPLVDVRCGFTREPSRFSAGIGLHHGLFTLDYAFTFHPVLGGTHQASISFAFGQTQPDATKTIEKISR